MSDFIAMATEGTMYARDGVELSWPKGGQREVIELPADRRPYPVQLRITNGVIVEVDGPATPRAQRVLRPTVLTGPEARRVRSEPAGPVTRRVYERATDSLRTVPIMGSPIEPPVVDTPEADNERSTIASQAQVAVEKALAKAAAEHQVLTATEIAEVAEKAAAKAQAASSKPSRSRARSRTPSARNGRRTRANTKKPQAGTDAVRERLSATIVGEPQERSGAPEPEPITSTGSETPPDERAASPQTS
jgi:hypothetical protein